ncbi:carboxypeptidase-like regulatory domain-containing protein [Myroides fluvii]|uniref:carboxypeptidase-like regulatory domain-containing protein n=1 Tax=Myroides fluvii TaxID=2572594 RepID=UPI00131D3C86|nr:carboxypeptidase-like regulatory domain-containing protein [Myroides fluvii]
MANYIIQIPEPCSEDWNQMTPVEKGRFCAVCEKEIYDFSAYTEQELIQQIKKEGEICGRVPAKYLDIELNESTANRGIGLRGLVAATINLLVLTTATSVQGQTQDPVEQSEQQKGDSSENLEVTVLPTQPLKRMVTGQVIDEEGLGLAGAIVIIKGTEHGVAANFDGQFAIEIPEEINDVELYFSFFGTEDYIKKIKDFEKPLVIRLRSILDDEKTIITTGGIIVKKKKKWLFF